MEDWLLVLSVIAPQILVIVALFAFVWKPYRNDVRTYKEEVGKLRNDVAWANKDLAGRGRNGFRERWVREGGGRPGGREFVPTAGFVA